MWGVVSTTLARLFCQHFDCYAQYTWSSVFLPAYTLKILELCVVVLLTMTSFVTIVKGWYFKTSIHHTRSTRLREIAEADILNKSNAFLDSEHSAAPNIKHTNGILHHVLKC